MIGNSQVNICTWKGRPQFWLVSVHQASFLHCWIFPCNFDQFHPPFQQNFLAKNTSISVLQSGSVSSSLSLPDTTDVERVTGDSQAAQYSLYWTSTLLHLLIIHNYHSLFIFCSSYLYFLSCLFTSFFEYSNWLFLLDILMIHLDFVIFFFNLSFHINRSFLFLWVCR